MKRAVTFAAICGLFIAVASQTAYAADNISIAPGSGLASTASQSARLIIKRSPTLGDNVSITVTIDGKVVGSLVRYRALERAVGPGRHVLVASPNRARGNWYGTIDVHPGETCVLVAKYSVDRLILQRQGTDR